MNIKVLYEDNHIIAVEKDAGLLTQQDITGKVSLMDLTKEYIKKKYNKPGNVFLGMVQRLDKNVSGIVVFTKTSKAAKKLNAEFLNRNVTKIYITLVPKNNLYKGEWIELEQNILIKKGFSQIDDSNRYSKKAKLQYRNIFSNDNYSLLLINLLTGRKHQIRAQLSSIDMPIIGDQKYGSKEKIKNDMILLHALYISFIHPIKKERIELYSEIPDRFSKKIVIDNKMNDTIKVIIHDLIKE